MGFLKDLFGGAKPDVRPVYPRWMRKHFEKAYDRSVAEAEKYGQSLLDSVSDFEKQAPAKVQQRMISRGMANTSVNSAMQRGVSESASRMRSSALDDIFRVRMAALMQQPNIPTAFPNMARDPSQGLLQPIMQYWGTSGLASMFGGGGMGGG